MSESAFALRKSYNFCCPGFCLFLCLALALPAEAQTIRAISVDPINDDTPELGCSLREAIELANAVQLSGLDCLATESGSGLPIDYVISVPELSYALTGIAGEDGNLQGDLDIAGRMRIVGAGRDLTVIDSESLDRVFHVLNTDATLTLEHLTVRDGERDNGGAVFVHEGALTARDVLFINNTANQSGGAIYGIGSEIVIEDSRFEANHANSRGGALCSLVNGTVSITHSVWVDNSARDGGALYVENTATVAEIDGGVFLANTAENGGGAIVRTGAAQGRLNIINSIVAMNHALRGGGISCTFCNIANTSIFRNEAFSDGGGVALTNSTMSHTTVVDNTADANNNGNGVGGGITTNTETLTLKNSIVAGNRAGLIGGQDCDGSPLSAGNNVLGSNDLCLSNFPAGVPNMNADLVGTAGLPLDPGVTLQGTMLPAILRPSSIARNRIGPTDCTFLSFGTNNLFANGAPVLTDQRGVLRDALCDIGAFESFLSVEPLDGLITTESGTNASASVVLPVQPTDIVEIPLIAIGEIELSSAALTFTPGTWDQPQTIEIAGLDDAIDDGDQPWTVDLAPIISNDLAFVDVDPVDVQGTNLDDDTAAVVVTPTTGLTTTPAGGTATFEVQLASEPLAAVEISFVSSDIEQGDVDLSTLIFGTADWQTPKTITITGAGDLASTAATPYTIVITVLRSDDALYAGLDPDDVSVVNQPDRLFASGFEQSQ
ncbi:MAG: hypothetical protein AAGA23_06320 [Pseudomonadota bacterium]